MSSGPPQKRLRQSTLTSITKSRPTEIKNAPLKILQLENGLTIGIDPPKDGDCQFRAVAFLLRKHLQLTLSHEDVRADAVKYLSGEEVLLLDGTPYNFQQHIITQQQTTHDYLSKMSRHGTFGDHITLVAIACVYKVQFIVISTLGENATRIISPSMNSCHVPTLPTLILGHVAEGHGTHYVGLLPNTTETLTNIIQKYVLVTSPSSSVPVPERPPSSCSMIEINKFASDSADVASWIMKSGHFDTDADQSLNDLGIKGVGPKQPQLALFPKTLFGKQNRSFSTSYYANYPWLEYSVKCDAVFCFACRHFHTDRRFVEELFISKGLKDWKKLSEKLSKHAISQTHISHMQKWLSFQSTDKKGSVVLQLSEERKKDVMRNRQYVAMVCDIVKLLTKLGLPFRGHNEGKYSTSKGNFLELCDFLSTYVESFSDMQRNYFNCSSPEFQNDIINICGEAVQNEIVNAIRQVGFFTIMADEARSSKTEQLSLCVRYADGLFVRERFVCFIDCSSSRDAEGITKSIKDSLQKLKLQDVPIVGQSYDGAAVMSGHVSGVQTRMRVDNPVAMYFHCLAHKLNLVLVEACRVNRIALGFFNTIEQLYKFFANPGMHAIFLNIQKNLGLKAKEIGQLSDTRWACRWKSIEAVKTNYAAIVNVLSLLSDPAENCSAEAAGLYLHIRKTEFLVALIILEDFLRIIHVAHKALQCSSITLAKAGNIVERLTLNFRNKRSHKSFLVLYRQAVEFGQAHGIHVDIPLLPDLANTPVSVISPQSTATSRNQRTVKTASSLRDFFVSTTLGQRASVDNSYRDTTKETMQSPVYYQLYLPVCETITGQLEFRFDKDSLMMAKSVDSVLCCNKDGIKALVDKYANILNISPQLLTAEMELFSCKDSEISIDVIQKELTKEVYPHYYRMVQLALTLPVGSATAERSFSTMRRIRNWLRSTMGQERFSSLALLNIESDLTAALVPEQLVNMYANSGVRRLKML
jgi:Domain of unknown function (DUF4371)/hAT family C-terminal dimerisation region/OTU-like cysteine protease